MKNIFGSTRASIILSEMMKEFEQQDPVQARWVHKKLANFFQDFFTGYNAVSDAFEIGTTMHFRVALLWIRDALQRARFLAVPKDVLDSVVSIIQSYEKRETRRYMSTSRHAPNVRRRMIECSEKHKARYMEAKAAPRLIYLALKERAGENFPDFSR